MFLWIHCCPLQAIYFSLGPISVGSSPLSLPRPGRKSAAGTLQKHRLHTCPTQTPQVQHLPASPPGCQCSMSRTDTWAESNCAWCHQPCYLRNSLSLSLTKAAGIVFCCSEIVGMNAADALHPSWSNPVNVFLVFHTVLYPASSWRKSMRPVRRCPRGGKPCFPKNHTYNQQTWLCPFISP